MRIPRFNYLMLLCVFFLTPVPQALAGNAGYEDPVYDLGVYGSWGIGLPGTVGAGLSYKMFKLGASTGITGHSLAYNLGFMGRTKKFFISPLIGANLSYVNAQPGEVNYNGFSGGRRGVIFSLAAGFGIRFAPGAYLDCGVSLIRNIGIYPFVQLTWPFTSD